VGGYRAQPGAPWGCDAWRDEPSGGATSGREVSGTVTLQAAAEIDAEVCKEALHRALVEVLTPAAGPSLHVDVLGGEAAQADGLVPGVRVHEFSFVASVPDPNDRTSAVEVLKLEATFGGARRLLPAIADSCTLDGSLAIRLQLVPSVS